MKRRILGLDVGDKTIGVAVSDPMGIIAQGVETIQRQSKKKDGQRILHWVEHYQVERIVVGLPKNMDNTLGPQADKTMHFAKYLMELGLEIVYEDERLSTRSSEMLLMEQGVRREHRKKYIDKIAATYILQTYLDREK
ncbi:MAG: Holliday junction resolvase RuvX [Tissierellia bacterium]|nr:Holliday junction resolvase RuvX [Tissierellia bacterium]